MHARGPQTHTSLSTTAGTCLGESCDVSPSLQRGRSPPAASAGGSFPDDGHVPSHPVFSICSHRRWGIVNTAHFLPAGPVLRVKMIPFTLPRPLLGCRVNPVTSQCLTSLPFFVCVYVSEAVVLLHLGLTCFVVVVVVVEVLRLLVVCLLSSD